VPCLIKLDDQGLEVFEPLGNAVNQEADLFVSDLALYLGHVETKTLLLRNYLHQKAELARSRVLKFGLKALHSLKMTAHLLQRKLQFEQVLLLLLFVGVILQDIFAFMDFFSFFQTFEVGLNLVYPELELLSD